MLHVKPSRGRASIGSLTIDLPANLARLSADMAAVKTRRAGKGWSKGMAFVDRRKCEQCGGLFYAPPVLIRRGGGRFCSKVCRGKSMLKDQHYRACKSCGQQFMIESVAAGDRCPQCRQRIESERNKRLEHACGGCGKRGIPKRQKYCDMSCRSKGVMQKPKKGLTPTALCRTCGAPFYASPGHLRAGMGLYCSRRCTPLVRHSAGKGGTREDLGLYVRSSWEANYARYLNWLQQHGEIIEWQYEPRTFEFTSIKRGVRSYTPDFRVVERNGTVAWHEVKGYMDDKSRVKLARMARFYPGERIVLIQTKEMRAIKAAVGRLIPGWESHDNDKLGSQRAVNARMP